MQKYRYKVSYDIVFYVPYLEENPYKNLSDELKAIAQSTIKIPRYKLSICWPVPTGTRIVDFNKHTPEFIRMES